MCFIESCFNLSLFPPLLIPAGSVLRWTFISKAVSTFGRLREIKYVKIARKMYKVTYQVAFEMQKRIRRPCGFSVGVGEGLSHCEDFNFKNSSRAGRGGVSRHARENWSSWRHLKDYKKREVSPQDTSQLKILWNSRIWHPRSLSALHMGRWCYFELECGRSPLCLQCCFTHLGGKKMQSPPPMLGLSATQKSRWVWRNWFILILKDNFFYYAAVWMRMWKLCSSVKISRLDNNWGFCDVYVYKESPRLFVEGHQNMANFSLFPLYTATVGHWSASRGSDSFVLLLLSLPARLLHTLPVTIK